MKGTRRLHDAGQSIWLDNLTRGLLRSGGLKRYVDEFLVTGLTSNPTIFDNAIRGGQDYDPAIRDKISAGRAGEALLFDLVLEDLTQAADLFRPIHELTNRVDGWVSLALRGQLGVAVGKQTYGAYRELLASDRWLRLLNCGARSQRLLFASTGTKDPKLSDLLYVAELAAPHTINTMPEKTLLALADHGELGALLARDGGDPEEAIGRF